MIEKLVQDLIESIADTVVATAIAMAEDHQQRRDKVAAYRSALHSSATKLLTAVEATAREAIRNRYSEWIEHPRLGHEPLSAELQVSDIGLQEAVVAMKRNPTIQNEILLSGACIRLTAITEAVGAECVYLPSIKRATPTKAVRRKKVAKAKDDKRLNRRKPVIGDVPKDMWPIIAGLGSDDLDRSTALAKLEAQRGGDHDHDGIITKLATLAALTKHRGFIDDLAIAAKAALGVEAEAVPSKDRVSSPEAPIAAEIIANALSASQSATPIPATEPADESLDARIATVADWCRDHAWAVVREGAGYGLKRLGQRGDLNVIFNAVAKHPDMQRTLGEIYAARNG